MQTATRNREFQPEMTTGGHRCRVTQIPEKFEFNVKPVDDRYFSTCMKLEITVELFNNTNKSESIMLAGEDRFECKFSCYLPQFEVEPAGFFQKWLRSKIEHSGTFFTVEKIQNWLMLSVYPSVLIAVRQDDRDSDPSFVGEISRQIADVTTQLHDLISILENDYNKRLEIVRTKSS